MTARPPYYLLVLFRRLLMLLVLAGLALPQAAGAARPLRIGFLDGLFSTGEASTWMGVAQRDGADIVRIPIGWKGLAPARPQRPADPADPAYAWTGLDASVKAAVARGVTPFISLSGAPRWAEGAGRPARIPQGAWRPDAAAYGDFARALARRYDGTFPDPAVPGTSLPKVTAFQPWNEPNLDIYLAPQWVKRGRTFVTAAPAIYRDLQNAFTTGIRSVQPRALLVTAGTAPFGDPQPGGNRLMPVRFWRDVLCLTTELRRASGCGSVAFGALAHHPYSVAGPKRRALNADDVSVPDMGKLTRLLRAAERVGTAPGRHRLWVTEVSWDSKPDDPDGVPERTQATWLAQTMMVLWRQGVDTITWFQVRDQFGPDFAATVQSGTYRANGRAKLSARAFRFPLAVDQQTRTTVRVWLRAPARGTLLLQARRNGRWTTAKRLSATRHGVLQTSVTLGGATAIRGVQGSLTSLSADVG